MNPYEVLGLRETNDQAAIRRAYRRQARRWHPDYNQRPEAHDHFCIITQAYEQLRAQPAVLSPRPVNPPRFIQFPAYQTSTWEVFL